MVKQNKRIKKTKKKTKKKPKEQIKSKRNREINISKQKLMICD